MKESYCLPLSGTAPAIANLTQVSAFVWEVNRFNVPQLARGKGFGRSLIRLVTQAADKYGVTLVLYVSPYGGLDKKQLTAWYRRYGFVDTRPSDGLLCQWEMVRYVDDES